MARILKVTNPRQNTNTRRSVHQNRKANVTGKGTPKKRLQYNRDFLEKALEEYRRGFFSSLREAARAWSVPETTLRDRVKGRVKINCHYGKKTILIVAEERDMVKYLLDCAEIGIGKSKLQVKRMAYSVVNRGPNRKVPDSWHSKQQAGEDWYRSFMKRHRELSLRKPESLSYSRAVMTNENVIENYYTILEQTLDLYGLKERPDLIYNCDETGVCLDFRPAKVVAPKRARNVWSITSGERTNITVLACGNANGDMIDPLILFKGKRINEELVQTAPEGWAVKFTENGWMTTLVFEQWLQEVFVPHINKVRRSPEEHALLLLDGHSSHENLAVLEFAKENNIVIFCLPPHVTHILQPLDVSYFRSLKVNWDLEGEKYSRQNNNQFVKKATFCKVFALAWKKTAERKTSLTNGFRKCGLFPYKKISAAELSGQELIPADSMTRESYESQCDTASSHVGKESQGTEEYAAQEVQADAPTNETSEHDEAGVAASEPKRDESPDNAEPPEELNDSLNNLSDDERGTILVHTATSQGHQRIANLQNQESETRVVTELSTHRQESSDAEQGCSSDYSSDKVTTIIEPATNSIGPTQAMSHEKHSLSPFKVPSFYRQPTTATKRRSVPFCRVLTDENVMTEKREKLKAREADEQRKQKKREERGKKTASKVQKSKQCNNKRSKKRKVSNTSAPLENEPENVQCMFCQEWFLDGMGGKWCMCINCKDWCHCECAGLEENDENDYTCDLCRNPES